MDKALFADVSHALHVSYLVLSLPPRQKSGFRSMLIHVLDGLERPNQAQRDWLAQLQGPDKGYDPDRLTTHEFRAQCAMVTSAARTRLPSPEYGAVLARFAHGEEKLAGCKQLAVYARRSCGITALTLLLDLTARHYLPRTRRQSLTIRALAEKHKVDRNRVFRAAKWMEDNFRALENMALERLEPKFIAHGLVEPRDEPDQHYLSQHEPHQHAAATTTATRRATSTATCAAM